MVVACLRRKINALWQENPCLNLIVFTLLYLLVLFYIILAIFISSRTGRILTEIWVVYLYVNNTQEEAGLRIRVMTKSIASYITNWISATRYASVMVFGRCNVLLLIKYHCVVMLTVFVFIYWYTIKLGTL